MPIPNASKPKIARRLLRDEAHDLIRAAILDGTLAPGEQLDDASLQNWLGISRTPIREAIIALQVEGFVEIAAQTHTRVVDPTPEDVIHAIQTVGTVFGGVLRTIVSDLDDAARDQIFTFVERAKAAIAAADARTHMNVTIEYYRLMIERCKNPTLKLVADWAVTSLSFKYSITVDQREPNWEMLTHGWEQMHEAILAGDAVAAELACEDMHLLPRPGAAWAPPTWRSEKESAGTKLSPIFRPTQSANSASATSASN
ncbi:GntR family transcriptional regulator [Leucobacter musarum]|uniref:GntR family transcriptional regulator n=1 Tax=Leucobacter musarum TaxID=1930747 RepID=UPI0006A76674|nr:GntR family transcriptional regulator [Leucobacter musarum]